MEFNLQHWGTWHSFWDVVPDPALEISDFQFIKDEILISKLPKFQQAEAYFRLGIENRFRTAKFGDLENAADRMISHAASLGHPYGEIFIHFPLKFLQLICIWVI